MPLARCRVDAALWPRLRRWRCQATWLAESGVERAVFAIQQDADYSQEVWRVAAVQLHGQHAGQVEIRVRSETDDDSRVAVDVLAIYPYPSEFGVRARKRITVAKHNIQKPESRNPSR